MKRASPRLQWLLGWQPFAVLFVLWAVLYLPHLRTSPGWYGDETLTHHTSRNLASGTASNFALWNTFWHPHYPYQPAYSFINGLFARAFGGDILGSRFFNALLALASAWVIFGNGRRTFGFKASFFAAVMFLTYWQSVIHFRMSYAHNAVGFGLLVMTLFLLRPAGPKNDRMAGWGMMIGAAAHPLFIHGALAAGLCRIKRPRSWFRLFLPAGLCIGLSMLLAWSLFGYWLVEDLAHLKNVYTSRGAQDGSGWQGIENTLRFLFQDFYHGLLVLGLLACIPMRKYALPLTALLVVFLLARNRQNLIPFYYHAVVILPTLCLGWAGLWRFTETRLRRHLPIARHAYAFLALLPLMLLIPTLERVWQGRIEPRNHAYVTQSTDEVEAAAHWLNERTNKGEVVAGNANISWLLQAETVPYLQLVTWYGIPTQGYENGNKRERFRFDASLENCRFAVIGDIDRRWTVNEPNIKPLFDRMERENWPVVWQGEFYTILSNPRFQP
jgi:hypothetical protein